MTFEEVSTEKVEYDKQINITAYDGMVTVGKIIYRNEMWFSDIDGSTDVLLADTEEDAKIEMKDKLEAHFQDEINYYTDLLEFLSELN